MGHYRLVAGTCCWFRDVYCENYGENKATFWENVTSVSRAKLVLDDYKLLERSTTDVTIAMSKILLNAAKAGSIGMLQWGLIENGYNYDWRFFHTTGKRGHATVLEWAEASDIKWFSVPVALDASLYGNVPILEFIQSNQPTYLATWETTANIWQYAAHGGQLPVLEWLKDNQIYCNREGMTDLWRWGCIKGHVHVLDWLYVNGIEFDPTDVALTATIRGHTNVLQWALSHGATLSNKLSAAAAYQNNLDMLQWLRENECPWDGNVLHHGTDQTLLEWARINGCPEKAEFIFLRWQICLSLVSPY